MFFVSKVGCSGIVFLLMTPWISGPRPTPRPTPLSSGASLSSEVSGETRWNDFKVMQQTLQDEGHYQGKIDGVLGLRTRASIRGFQRAVNLPVTGQLDVQTAGKLGVRPEVREETSYETTQEKPSAGIKWANSSRRTGRTPRKPVKKSAQTIPPA
jgi:peptidoglycan hydrolase-like protein with peptidoglycan-binding domain